MHSSKLCASAKECMSKRPEVKSEEKDSKVKHDAWIKPKKCMPMTCFFKKSKDKDEFEDVNNKHSMLIDDCENIEDEDDEMSYCAMTKDVACSAVTSNDNNHKIKVNKSNVDESENKEACVVSECEGELKNTK